jgi:hypothetical protein
MVYESLTRVASKSRPGVTLIIRRMSFARRNELIRELRELAQRVEFHEAGGGLRDAIEAAAISAEVDRLYLAWGLAGVEGLVIDGKEATPEEMISAGPEDLSREAVNAIKAECGLSSDERKN